MPIEDVDYMKNNSIRQSYTFLVDSADRDRSVYPTPSYYVVDFTVPFKRVVGFEVVHASVPRTMYNIDVINNKIVFYIHDGAIALQKSAEAEIAPGEYTIQTLIVALNTILKMNVNGDPSKPFVSIVAESTTNPPDIENKLRFRCPYPFFIDMSRSTCAESLGFDEYTQLSERDVPDIKRRYDNPYPATNRQLYHSVDIAPEVALGKERVVFEGPRGVIRRTPATGRVAQRFRLEARGFLKQVFAGLYVDTVTTSSIATWEIRRTNHDDTAPDMIHAPLLTETIAVSFTDGTFSDSEVVNIPLEANTSYWILFYAGEAGVGVYYNDILPTVKTSSMLIDKSSNSDWVTYDNNDIYYALAVRIVVADEYHVLTAPGVYSLIGPKYIVMRCQEIEEQSFRSLAMSKHHLGLGMIKLGVVGYSENRMDFNKVPLREFHPIGKLTRLTLRFELPSGDLYDFKGVNHNITFAIHYLEPTQKEQFDNSILNPNYNGNFLNYMYHQDEQEEESDDEPENFDRDELDNYRKHESYYLPENRWRRDADFVNSMPQFRDLDEDENFA